MCKDTLQPLHFECFTQGKCDRGGDCFYIHAINPHGPLSKAAYEAKKEQIRKVNDLDLQNKQVNVPLSKISLADKLPESNVWGQSVITADSSNVSKYGGFQHDTILSNQNDIHCDTENCKYVTFHNIYNILLFQIAHVPPPYISSLNKFPYAIMSYYIIS